MVIERWRKEFNGKIIDIEVRCCDWWHQAFVNGKPITKGEANLEDLHDILFGNGCIHVKKNNILIKKQIALAADWQKIDWGKYANA